MIKSRSDREELLLIMGSAMPGPSARRRLRLGIGCWLRTPLHPYLDDTAIEIDRTEPEGLGVTVLPGFVGDLRAGKQLAEHAHALTVRGAGTP